MVTTNFEQIENDTYPDGDFYVYVFRCGEDILYVGESTYAPSRVEEHFAKQRSNFNLSQVIDKVGIDQIEVDMYDCTDILMGLGFSENRLQMLPLIYSTSYERAVLIEGKDSRKEFESKLIYELSPLCNGIGRKSDPEKVRILGNKYYPETIIIMPLVRN